jgi:CDP-diacylglycerol--glycerol-3-phosphate 3-phosphatidyltransferase
VSGREKEGGRRRKKPLFGEALALPNLITYARIVAIPVVLAIMQFDSRRNAFIAAMLFATASATDALDGYLARRYGLTSMIGKFLDPLADKLIVTGCLLMLLYLGRASPWLVFIIVSRETVITTLRVIAMGEGLEIAARDLGKQKTAFQMVGIWSLLVHYEYPLLDFIPEKVNFHRLGTYMLYISVFFSLLSAAEYFLAFFRTVAANEAASREEAAAPAPPEAASASPGRATPTPAPKA